MNVNLRGVFLHMMGDALGSIGVMVSAMVIKYVQPEDDPDNLRFLADPLCSLFIVGLLFKTTLPFVKETCRVLMQTVPEDINLPALHKAILADPVLSRLGLVAVHDLHVWSVNDVTLVASLHAVVTLRDGGADYATAPEDSNAIVLRLQDMLGGCSIDSTTVQLEFVRSAYTPSASCSLPTSLRDPAPLPAPDSNLKARRGLSRWASVRGAKFTAWASTGSVPAALAQTSFKPPAGPASAGASGRPVSASLLSKAKSFKVRRDPPPESEGNSRRRFSAL